jgi:hypothetical protein
MTRMKGFTRGTCGHLFNAYYPFTCYCSEACRKLVMAVALCSIEFQKAQVSDPSFYSG